MTDDHLASIHGSGQYFKIHLHCFHKDDPILRLAQPGDVLAIDIVARYQGWVNAVKYVSVDGAAFLL